MNRVRVALAVIAVAILVAVLMSMFASDETRIRQRLVDIESDFNAQRAGSLSRALTEEFRYGRRQMSRDEVKGILAREFFREGIASVYPYRVDFFQDEAEVLVSEDAKTAEVKVELRFEELKKDEWVPIEPIEAEMTLEKVEDQWLIREVKPMQREGPVRY